MTLNLVSLLEFSFIAFENNKLDFYRRFAKQTLLDELAFRCFLPLSLIFFKLTLPLRHSFVNWQLNIQFIQMILYNSNSEGGKGDYRDKKRKLLEMT